MVFLDGALDGCCHCSELVVGKVNVGMGRRVAALFAPASDTDAYWLRKG
jgi:hypothetical protein